MQQTTSTLLMIRPVAFRRNEQTAVNNYYQKASEGILPATINAKAQEEFDGLVAQLHKAGMEVIIVNDTESPSTPDSIFPNNWISFHQTADVTLYPMFAENRRLERRDDILDLLEEKGFYIEQLVDYSAAEEDGVFLEGTGSLVLDRENGKAYCGISPRSDEELMIEFCEDFEMDPVIFDAFQTVNGERKPIYHTNVMMSVGEKFAVICPECIDDSKERKMVLDCLKSDGKEIVVITEEQVRNFAGNILQVKNSDEERFIVMSESARQSFTPAQLKVLEKHGEIISAKLDTIETNGGGSARCMIAEVFLPKQTEE
ncbi:arginine deiminase-related protein [Flavobacterium sp. SM15]|uniref:citrulline utilization hydrolase CtlX n=1 Tax=Flavobacterium sp. SM15 TaxID=2908005 RepID=UPI001EDA87B1|nr:arginine deiminase-related protein [Flavobacterium sp. SM15]MCG2611304.1 arginine deiminase-related protein [Flavobacterium sp. SM15]